MSIDLSSFPTLLLVSPGLAQAGFAIKSKLSHGDLQECEDLAKASKRITDNRASSNAVGDRILEQCLRLVDDYQLRLNGLAFRERCIEPLPKATPQAVPKSKSTSAFWATTPFQVMGALQAVGHEVDAAGRWVGHALDGNGAKIAAVGAVAIAAVAAVVRLRCGFDTSGFSDLALKFSAL